MGEIEPSSDDATVISRLTMMLTVRDAIPKARELATADGGMARRVRALAEA
jgi:hypothetical protein